MTAIIAVLLAFALLRALVIIADRPTITVVRPAESCVHEVALPEQSRQLVRHRPAMRYVECCRQWQCPCGGIETDHHVALRSEHECAEETWS